ncbi:MAG: glycosyltransferase [Rikenellaceae bacterium]
MKQKILISAFACLPNWGSESGVGWHWVQEMSKYFELWVLVHKEQVVDIEKYVKENRLDNKIHFIYYDIPFNSLFFKNGIFRWVRLYYYFWTILSNKIVKKAMEENDIKIFHHLTFGNAIWNVSKYGRKQFFIWGPIGGMETIPADYTEHYDFKNRMIESVRRIVVKIISRQSSFKKRCHNADLILCKTVDTQLSIPVQYRSKSVIFTDVAVETINAVAKSNAKNNTIIDYIAVGHLDAWRGFDLLIESFNEALKSSKDIRLTILGEGVFRPHLKGLINKYGIKDKVTLKGRVSKNEYDKLLSKCDVVVNSCLKEGAVTVSFDCMRYGKPLICIDTGGFTQYFSAEYSIVLPKQSRESMIKSLSASILKLTDRDLRNRMGAISRTMGDQFSWERKGEQIRDVIMEAYNKRIKQT